MPLLVGVIQSVTILTFALCCAMFTWFMVARR